MRTAQTAPAPKISLRMPAVSFRANFAENSTHGKVGVFSIVKKSCENVSFEMFVSPSVLLKPAVGVIARTSAMLRTHSPQVNRLFRSPSDRIIEINPCVAGCEVRVSGITRRARILSGVIGLISTPACGWSSGARRSRADPPTSGVCAVADTAQG